MGDHDGRERRRDGGEGLAEREGGLLDLIRRVVAPRQPAVIVMEPDGRLRRSSGIQEERQGQC